MGNGTSVVGIERVKRGVTPLQKAAFPKNKIKDCIKDYKFNDIFN